MLGLDDKQDISRELEYNQNDKIKLWIPNVSSDSFQIDGVIDIQFSEIEFLNLLNEKLIFFGLLSFSYDFNDDGDAYVTMKVTLKEHGYAILDRRLSSILGFNNTTFENGIHKGKRSFDRTLLKNTKQDTVVKYVKYTSKLIDFQEPSDASLDSVAEALHMSFKNEGEDVMVTVDDNEEYMEFDIKNIYVEFQLPASLSNYFLISSDHIFANRTSILLPHTIKLSNENILCCVDLIDHQLYGNKEFQIIRNIYIENSAIKGQFQQCFESIQYFPLTKQVFRTATVSFTISSSKFTISSNPASVLFHVKKI
ncbi:unnamed protein product [Orchesella dallaii]|uniref:Uncharacterized protein n=1 Tax=Orchesella dallaii TaxID=48710 RepID=A0ABP1QV78_9HEXA